MSANKEQHEIEITLDLKFVYKWAPWSELQEMQVGVVLTQMLASLVSKGQMVWVSNIEFYFIFKRESARETLMTKIGAQIS